MHQKNTISRLRIAFTALLLVGCQAPAAPQYQANPNRPKPTQDDIARVSAALVEERCESPKSHLEYEACIAILYAKMPALDVNKRDHFGERYDPKTWYACMQDRGDHRYYRSTSCDIYGLRRWDENISKPHIDMPEIKWPKSTELPPPQRGMSNYDYFRMLCEKEAGEVIYRTVENVEGLFQMRPTFFPSDQELSDRYVLEDPYSTTRDDSSAPWDVFVQPNIGEYNFLITSTATLRDKQDGLERVDGKGILSAYQQPYIRFYRKSGAHPGSSFPTFDPGRPGGGTSVPYIVVAEQLNNVDAQYGYTWRGIGDASLRNHGIAGGEQIVVDLKTGEVLAWRRSFMYSDLNSVSQSSWWAGARHCNRNLTDRTVKFIKRVLKPTNQK